MSERRWYENDTKLIAAHGQPAALIDLARDRGIEVNRLLRGTAMFYGEILGGELRISPLQFYRLLDNARRLLGADDTSFLFGHRLFPGSYGAVSAALLNAGNLQQAIDTLVRYRQSLSPLLTPRVTLTDSRCFIHWIDSCGAGEAHRFLVEAWMGAFTGLCRWLSGERLPWRFHLSYPQPRYLEQYQVHLGEQLRFGAAVDVMEIPREWLYRPWPKASAAAWTVAQREAARELEVSGYQGGILEVLHRYLLRQRRRPVSLEQVAAEFAMSPATLKRKLQKHGTHFQRLYDSVRLQVALYLLQVRGFSNEEVADYLAFHDATNFRRSFKRWTGLTPSAFRIAQ